MRRHEILASSKDQKVLSLGRGFKLVLCNLRGQNMINTGNSREAVLTEIKAELCGND